MQISEQVKDILGRAKFSGANMTLPPLSRDEYAATAKVFIEAGGKWSRGAKAVVFDREAQEVINELLDAGEIATQSEFGYFPTPQTLAKQIVELAEIKTHHLVLEPSAGQGAIADEIMANVVCIELQPKNAYVLESKGYPSVHVRDFLEVEPEAIYDRLVMNPPFAKSAAVDHVNHALKFLKPGGRLVAVMPSGIEFRTDRKHRELREVIAINGSITRLPQGSFKEAGTEVNVVVVVIDTTDIDF
jgi:protein-L-isoaspartate O-methyltransferase